MLKLMGAAMVITAAAAFALYRLSVFVRRLRLVREMKNSMAYISSYIGFSVMPLEELVTELLKRSDKCIRPALEYFLDGMKRRTAVAELWRESLFRLAFTEKEIRVFEVFGGCLGMTDRNLQIKTAESVIREAERCEEELIKQIEKYKTVDIKLVIMAGITAVVVLL